MSDTDSVYKRARDLLNADEYPYRVSVLGEASTVLLAAIDAGEKAGRELREWKLALQNQVRVEPGRGPNPEADEIRACMAEGLAAARRGHFELITRAEAAEKRVKELEAEVECLRTAEKDDPTCYCPCHEDDECRDCCERFKREDESGVK